MRSHVSGVCSLPAGFKGFQENPCRILSRRTPVESFIQPCILLPEITSWGIRLGKAKNAKKSKISNKLDIYVQLSCLEVKTQQGGKYCYITLRPAALKTLQFPCSLIVSSFLLQELNQWEPYNSKRLVVGSISRNQSLISFLHECCLCYCKCYFSAPVQLDWRKRCVGIFRWKSLLNLNETSPLSFQIMPKGRRRGSKWHATKGSTRHP